MQRVLSYRIALDIFKTLNSFLPEIRVFRGETLQPLSRREEIFARQLFPVGVGESPEHVVGRTSAVRRHGAGQRRLRRVETLDGVPHPVADQALWDEIAAGVLLIGDVDGKKPRLAIRVLPQEGG